MDEHRVFLSKCERCEGLCWVLNKVQVNKKISKWVCEECRSVVTNEMLIVFTGPPSAGRSAKSKTARKETRSAGPECFGPTFADLKSKKTRRKLRTEHGYYTTGLDATT